MTRSEGIAVLRAHLGPDDVALFTTGHISRQAYAAGDREWDFYMIGSMGLLASVGLGIALARPDRRVVVVDGDGSALMGLGTLAQIGHAAPANLVHVVLDNEAYVSTGGQRTISRDVNLAAVASAAGYRLTWRAADAASLSDALSAALREPGPSFVLVKVPDPDGAVAPRVPLEPTAMRDRLRRALQPRP